MTWGFRCLSSDEGGNLEYSAKNQSITSGNEVESGHSISHPVEEPWEDPYMFFQANQVLAQVEKKEPLIVRTISGATVAELSPRNSENAASLKKRIFEKEGTAVFMQKIVQGGEILNDTDIVSGEPLVLVRMPRKRVLIASIHADLRAYDLENGAAMRVVPSLCLRLSCMVADWDNARCFTGSADGVVRVWDVHSCECLGKIVGLQDKVSALASDQQDHLAAVSASGIVRIWKLEDTGGAVRAKDFHEWQTKVSGRVVLAVEWEHSVVLVSGESKQFHFTVCAYDLRTQKLLWSWRLPGESPALVFDWGTQRCLLAPGHQFLELRGIGTSASESRAKFAHDRLHHKCLLSVDWPSAQVIFIARPFALELWSLSTYEMLHSLRDVSGDGLEIISLDVDWTQPTPQAITCRTYIDWELVAGEVCIQHWEVQNGGDIRNVAADHPLIGGFDIMAAVAQF